MSITKEYIICSAIHIDDGIERSHLPQNVKTGIVASGLRHGNCLTLISEIYGFRKKGKYPKRYFTYKETEGFLTSYGRFVDRYEGAEIAYWADQTDEKLKRLHSEDLW